MNDEHRMFVMSFNTMSSTSSSRSDGESGTIHLPGSVEKLHSEVFQNMSITTIMKMCASNSNKSTGAQAMVCKYSGRALFCGRPMDSVIILMAGPSGAGKSSTVNALFGDDNLCQTSSRSSETKDVAMVRKLLRVTAETPAVSGFLGFVDVPGMFDTDSSNEAPNLAAIRKVKTSRPELKDRAGYSNFATGIRKHVYPNVVLFVVRATENRLEGKDSFLAKSLKVFRETANFVDSKNSNVIIVLTHVMMLPRKKEKWIAALNEKTLAIQQQVHTILGISNVEVVPVENEPDDYDLVKSGDFYLLPNGQLSHCNLYDAMLRVFDKSGDLLGSLMTSWYFHGDCPEKKQRADKTNVAVSSELDEDEIALSAKHLGGINIVTPQLDMHGPIYNFQRLAHGYCPVTEEFKADMPLASLGDPQTVQIENSKFLIPKFVQVYKKRSTGFQRQSFMEKTEYQDHMQHKYGLDASFKLVVTVNSNGKWVNSGAGSTSTTLVSLVHEIQLATFSLGNPGQSELNPAFRKELDELPDEYKPETGSQFQAFFSRWGSHMVVEQAVGGAVQLDCFAQCASLSRQQLGQVDLHVSGMFKQIFSGQGGSNHSTQMNDLKAIGITSGNFRIDGGSPPGLVTLESAASEDFKKWEATVGQDPVELRSSIKLYPYTNFLPTGPKHKALHEATKDYVSNTLSAKVQKAIDDSRNSKASAGIQNTVQQGGGGGCFPSGALVCMQDGTYLEIEKLSQTSQKLQTLRIAKTPTVSTTNFCTYLDRDVERLVEYLILEFENDRKLTVTPNHMIFEYIAKTGRPSGKQAKNFKVGDRVVYIHQNASKDNVMEEQKIVRISRAIRQGAYSPLTTSGTLIVEGFLVSSYCDIDSFQVAQAALLPLKLWCKMGKNWKEMENQKSSDGGKKVNGIHPYAKFLISLRKGLTQ